MFSVSSKSKTKSIFKTVKNILSVSIPMSLSSILTSLNRNIDSMTVKRGLQCFLSESESLKQYGILSGKVDTLTTLPLSFNIAFATALVPTITKAKTNGDMETIQKRISFSLLVTMLIGMPCMVGMIIFANPILDLLFPNATEGATIFRISSISIIFIVLEQTVNGALQGLGKIISPAIALMVGVLVKLVLNLILVSIPQVGVIGAAFAIAMCHVIAFIIGFNILSKNIKLNLTFSKFVIKPALATIAMGICSYAVYYLLICINFGKLATIISIFIAVIIYFLSVIILRIFSEDEFFMIPYGKIIYRIMEKLNI